MWRGLCVYGGGRLRQKRGSSGEEVRRRERRKKRKKREGDDSEWAGAAGVGWHVPDWGCGVLQGGAGWAGGNGELQYQPSSKQTVASVKGHQ